jgi:cyclopropane fatty-acyl-phospholipid synthase-like methyltransferase
MLATAFDQAYQRTKPVFGPRPDRVLAETVLDNDLHGRALDLGAGDGRNSLFLAYHGFEVSALEVSETAVARLNDLAESRELPIEATLRDIREWGDFAGKYDLIVADTVLCHLNRDEVHLLADEISDALVPGGWFYASAFARDDPRQSEFAPLVQTYFDAGEFCDLFPRLRHDRCTNLWVLDRRHGTPHHHSLLQLVAWKERQRRER